MSDTEMCIVCGREPEAAGRDGCCDRWCQQDVAELDRLREVSSECAQADCTVCGEPTCADPAACEAWPDAPDCRERCEYGTCRSCTDRDDARILRRRTETEARWPLP